MMYTSTYLKSIVKGQKNQLRVALQVLDNILVTSKMEVDRVIEKDVPKRSI